VRLYEVGVRGCCSWFAALFLLFVTCSPTLQAQRGVDYNRLGAEAAEILSGYLKIDTSNPPGNEIRGAEYLAGILQREGIDFEIIESEPGRANLYARLKGRPGRGALLLLHHIDVAPAEADSWSVPPFSGLTKDGALWGRGAVDAKSLGVVHLMSFLSAKRSRQLLRRDLVFLATADEEAGGEWGVRWLLENRPELFRDVEYVLTEGGSNIVRADRLLYVGLETTQKVPMWVRLTSRGEPGHGSVPRNGSAMNRLIRALERITRYRGPVDVVPEVASFFRFIAPFQEIEMRERFLEMERFARDPEFFRRLPPYYQSLLRSTIAVTVVRGGHLTNSIPSVATAELDCRLLPSQDPDTFLEELSQLISDPGIETDVLLSSFTVAASSPDTSLVRSIRHVTRRLDARAVVGPSVQPGFTDSRFFRERGIASYGFEPFRFSSTTSAGVHGNDERISLADFNFGLRYFHQVVAGFVF
jgi:acetylornithine deacetylase/succinyl-diaminopimelate desuccinylase-like protein